MELIKQMNIPATFLYDKVVDSVLFDIRKATGKTVTRKQLKDFEYVKEFSASNRAKIKIEEAIDNSVYRFRTSTTKNDFLVQYEIKPLTETSCELHYTEKMKSFGFLQQLNDMALGFVFMFLKKRRFKKMLQMMEESY